MRETARPEVLTNALPDRLVLAEHHPARERRVGRRQPRGDGTLCSLPQQVEDVRDAAPPPARCADVVHEELAGDAAAAQVRPEVEGARRYGPRAARARVA
jgi:hypothetical protein